MKSFVVWAQALIYAVHLTGFSLISTQFVGPGIYALLYIGIGGVFWQR